MEFEELLLEEIITIVKEAKDESFMRADLKALLNQRLEKERIDISLPSTKVKTGSKHPMSRIQEQFDMWNKYAGKSNILYIHARIGGLNWKFYNGDEIIAIDGLKVIDNQSLLNVLLNSSKDNVKLEIKRDGKTLFTTINIVLSKNNQKSIFTKVWLCCLVFIL